MIESAPGPGRPRVMIVAASMPLRRAIGRCLDNARPSDCFEAASGEEALGILQVRTIDLLLVDGELPGMPAQELVRHLTLLQPAAQVVVLAEPEQHEALLRDAGGALDGSRGNGRLADDLRQVMQRLRRTEP